MTDARASLKEGGAWLGAASGVGVPAYTFFSSYPPPLFPGVSLLSAALSGAILVIALAWTPKPDAPSEEWPRIIKLGGRLLTFAVPVLVVYILLLQFTTFEIQGDPGDRLQIGFGTADWTLTSAGQSLKKANPVMTVEDLIMTNAATTQSRVPIVWQTWSVYCAGSLLIVLHLVGFFLWTAAFALLGKHESLVNGASSHPGATP